MIGAEHSRRVRYGACNRLEDTTCLRSACASLQQQWSVFDFAPAAHELGSPLVSMGMIVREWRRDALPPELRRDADILSSQIDACKEALAHLRAAARAARVEGGAAQPLDHYLTEVVACCRTMRPGIALDCELWGPLPAPTIVPDPALKQAVLVLLNNAADAAPHDVRLAAQWDDRELELRVTDRGPGIPPSRLRDLGRTFFATKPPGSGNGLGVMLTASTVARLRGTITWSNRPEGGAMAHVRMPLSSLQRDINRGF